MMEKIIKNLIPIVIVIAGLIIAGAFFYFNQDSSNDIGMEKAGQKAIDYINENLLVQGATASLIDILDMGSVYKISLVIKEGENVLGEIDSYIGKDGAFFFPEGYNMNESLAQDLVAETTGQPEAGASPLSLEEIKILDNFVQCLANANFVIYGNKGCSACAGLAAQFGGYDIVGPIFVECTEELELCEEKKITQVPTIFINDKEYSGARSFEGFAKETGCSF